MSIWLSRSLFYFTAIFLRTITFGQAAAVKLLKTPPHIDQEERDRHRLQRSGEPRFLTAAIRMLWNEYKYSNYMTENSSTMLYASYTILLGRLQTCRVGSERVRGTSVRVLSVLCVKHSLLQSVCSPVPLPVNWLNCQPGIFLKNTNRRFKYM